MDRHAEGSVKSATRVGARRGIAFAALLLTLASGCVSSGELVPEVGTPPPPVTQLAAIWGSQLMAGQDPVHNGAPMYGIAGRVYLFGQELHDFMLADGKLVVEMYGLLPEQPQGPMVPLETWEIKKEILNSVCLRKDVGQGYTMNLPWEHYRPDVTRLEIRTRYEPAKGGMPIYTQNMVTLNNGPGYTPMYTNRTETGDRHVITTGAPPTQPQPMGVMPPPVPPVAQPGGVQPAVFQTPMPMPGPQLAPAQPFPSGAMPR